MARSRSRTSTSTDSLMQDVPGAFPLRSSGEEADREQSAYLTLSQAIHARRAEYVRPKHVRIKIGTWNVAAYKGAEKDVGGWFVEGKGISEALAGLKVEDQDETQGNDGSGREQEVEGIIEQEARYTRKKETLPQGDHGSLPGNDDIGLYVLGLQEVVDITSTTEALRPYTDPSVAAKWRSALETALPIGYQLVAEQQLIGLLLLIYASPDLASEVRSVSTTSVGTGLMGYMGNKGAVTARIVIGDTTRLVFINSHLAAGADKASLERRNWDASQIVQRTKFEPIKDAMDLQQSTGEQIGDEDLAFWVGDLNYRLEGVPGDDVRRLLMLHTRNEYDLSQNMTHKIDHEIQLSAESAKSSSELGASSSSSSSSSALRSSEETSSSHSTKPSTAEDAVSESEDPTSLQATLSSLLPHDELQQQMKSRRAFHDGWREAPITFLPTYKYDAGSVGVFDSSEKKRAPSWCDRILFRTRRDKLAYDSRVREEDDARKRDEQMKAAGTDQAGDDESILYDYDPETDGANANGDYDEYDEHHESGEGMLITKEGFEDEIKIEYYTSHQRVLSSDHKPLNAIFSLKYDAVVPELKAKVHAEVAKDLDKVENEGRPNVTVVVDQHGDTQAEQCEDIYKEFEGAWFGDVRLGQSKHRTLTIANTGRVPASFTFIERPVGPGQAPGIAPSWLNLKLDEVWLSSSNTTTAPVNLEPGETATVELEIRILEMKLVQALNEGIKSLDDILVLRVEGGRDHFIPVKANWRDTSLGRSIDKLIRIPEGGIRRLQNQRPGSSKSRTRDDSGAGSGRSTPTTEQPVRFSAPRELFRLTEAVEAIATRCIAEWGMISSDDSHESAAWVRNPGWPFDEKCWSERGTSHWDDAISEACNALDEDEPLEASLPHELPKMQRLYVLSSLFILFLNGLPDGIITQDLWVQMDAYLAENERAKRKATTEEQRMAIQETLSQSPSHNISFILITSMLDRILQEILGMRQATAGSASSTPKKSGAGALHRMTSTFGKLPSESHGEQAITSWAHIFAHVIIRTDPSKKLNAAQEKRRRGLIELFLRRDIPG